jgi:phosphoserine phosphatase RsbU/P
MSESAMGTARILVVDDNEMNRDLLSRRLLRQGFEVEIAVNGRDALDRVATTGFDLVLLDIMMPEMNGYEVLERLKADEALCHLPVIMITAVDDVSSVVKCIEMGAEDYLPKPFNPTLLRARIDASLAKKRLRDREQLHARSLQRELEIGRTIQAGFLPDSLPQPAGWEIAARFRPARQVGGDFYDVFPLGDTGRVAVAVADVCDKGVGAALFMALFRSLFRAVAEAGCASDGGGADHLLATVQRVNDYIARTHARANMFATAFTGFLEPADGSLLYVNAGHDEPAVLHADGRLERLSPTGPALGLMPGLPFHVQRIVLDPGATLLAFTDGIPDARGPDGDTFGEERLLLHLASAAEGAEALLAAIDHDVDTFTQGADPFDDITLLALKRI